MSEQVSKQLCSIWAQLFASTCALPTSKPTCGSGYGYNYAAQRDPYLYPCMVTYTCASAYLPPVSARKPMRVNEDMG